MRDEISLLFTLVRTIMNNALAVIFDWRHLIDICDNSFHLRIDNYSIKCRSDTCSKLTEYLKDGAWTCNVCTGVRCIWWRHSTQLAMSSLSWLDSDMQISTLELYVYCVSLFICSVRTAIWWLWYFITHSFRVVFLFALYYILFSIWKIIYVIMLQAC